MTTEPTPLTVGDLSARHIGRRVRIWAGDNIHTGAINDLRYITEQTYGGARVRAVEIHFLGATIQYSTKAIVEEDPA